MLEVSVVVPIYNVENYLVDCLESLVHQTFKNFEVLMINDGSTDSSGEIAKKYAEQYNNFRLINRKNGGLSAARNTGIDNAKGEYIYFLDSDDYLIDTALEEMLYQSKKNDLDVLKFVAYVFYEDNRNLKWDKNYYYYKNIYDSVYCGRDILRMTIKNGDYFPSSCMIFIKKRIIDNNNIRFYEGIIHEDNLFNFELFSLADRTAILNKPLYCRRIRGGSITQAPDYRKKIYSFTVIIKMINEFQRKHNDIEMTYINDYIVFCIGDIIDSFYRLPENEKNDYDIKQQLKYIRCYIVRKSFFYRLNMLKWVIKSCI